MSHPLPRGLSERYELLAPIGSGGMSVVYAARDRQLGLKVALKLMKRDMAGGEEAERRRVRFLREAQALAMLSHPNVVRVHEAGTVGDQAYVSMELIEGSSMKEWLRSSARSYAEVFRVLVAAARGLKAAHEAGLVHRDFKPANVLVGQDGRVAVTDFGLVRMGQRVGSMATTARTPGGKEPTLAALGIPLTVPGAVLGTPGYMSPEQIQGQAADERADQFGFAVSAWEALYKEKPFQAEASDLPPDIALAMEMIEGKVRPPPIGSKVPENVRRVLERALAPHPDQRYPSVAELLAELEALAPGRVPPWRGAAVGAAAGLLLLGSFILFGRSGSAELCRRERAWLARELDARALELARARAAGGPAELWAPAEWHLRRAAEQAAEVYQAQCIRAPVPPRDRVEPSLACVRARLTERSLADLSAAPEPPEIGGRRAEAYLAALPEVAGCAVEPALPEARPASAGALLEAQTPREDFALGWRRWVRAQTRESASPPTAAELAASARDGRTRTVLEASGVLLLALGHQRAALPCFRRAAELAPAEAQGIAWSHVALAAEGAEAVSAAERALAAFERGDGGGAEQRRASLLLGERLVAVDPARARAQLLAVAQAATGEAEVLARARAAVGIAELAEGEPLSATSQLERALELALTAHLDPRERARIRFALAQALLTVSPEAPQEKARARGLLEASLRELPDGPAAARVRQRLETLGR